MASDHPLSSDNVFQARLHRGMHQRRRELLRDLIAQAELIEQTQPLDAGCFPRKLANKLTACGRMPTVWQDEGNGELVVSRALCRARLCPTCGRNRSEALRREILPLIREMDAARMLTLTLAGSDDPLAVQIKRLLDCWKRLRRRKIAAQYIRGGLYVVEITWNARTEQWHPHLHVVCDGQYWPQNRIADLWEEITGDSRIVDIRAVHSREHVARYVSKYVSKCHTPKGVSPARLVEWCESVHGLRMVQTFGHLHGCKVAQPPTQDRATLAHVIPLEPLLEEANHGDEEAAQLLAQLRTLTQHRPPANRPGDLEPMLSKHRELAEQLRAWWASLAARHSGDAPADMEPRPRRNHADQRPLWKRQDDDAFAGLPDA